MNNIKALSFKVSFLCLLVFITSCATRTKVVLDNTKMIPFKDETKVTVLSKQVKALQIVSVIDQRDMAHIGEARTGFRYKKIPVYLSQELKTFLEQKLVSEFSQRGVTLTTEEAPLKLIVTVNSFWVEEYFPEKKAAEAARCNVNLNFDIQGASRKFLMNAWQEYTSPGKFINGTDLLAPTLATCLNDVIEQVIKNPKFNKVLSK